MVPTEDDTMRKITEERRAQMKPLEDMIDYHFKRMYLLNRALTHSSYANQHSLSYVEHNERLEFLGDSVLSLVISEYIFKKYRNKPEGKLSKIRANIVCEDSLHRKAKKLDLGRYMLFGKGEEMTGGRERTSILADALEALIAAIYIDGGLEMAGKFVLGEFSDTIDRMVRRKYNSDYKSKLQEYIQKEQSLSVQYRVTGEEGPDHDKTFYVDVTVGDKYAGKGCGRSKKEAEQAAAKSALESLGASE